MSVGPQETQESISDWCATTFPPATTTCNGPEEEQESRFFSCLEEVIEIGHEMSIDPDKIMDVVERLLKRCEDQGAPNIVNVGGEIADLDICLKYLATSLGIHVQSETDMKMAKNRDRPQSYYDAKQAAKRAEGIR